MTAQLSELIADIKQIKLTDSQTYYGQEHEALPILVIKSDLCHAVIALQGAHVIEFQATGKAPLLWNSPKSQYKSGKAIRGGVPICFPWFGENQFDKSQASHGFVRSQLWDLVSAQVNQAGEVEIVFSFASSDDTLAVYPYQFNAEYKVTLGKSLSLDLVVANLSDQVMPVSFALHSYHPVSDLSTTSVEGLDWTTYLDNLQNYQAKIQQGPVVFDGEVDRIYLNVANSQIIKTSDSIKLSSDDCNSAIVWNPAFAKADGMADLGGENYTQFICVERGNAFANSWYLTPNQTRSANLVISNC
ncbi:D-hexose-6-phosphate mutarotase [Catenovulum maritimum]|uniref:Putative glucose-6-phosphate 1-epimerase n=1 Tax=Catenovulum maritimum TaxID=1513271 RepID=A0A0J8GZM9_9ALTE|nr:D-hexose-6-phosphate mutarotase [Catenovulum maritimum]KMT66689.1 hypothetical protein XM47_00725 [Catenovulum maritimum]